MAPTFFFSSMLGGLKPAAAAATLTTGLFHDVSLVSSFQK